MQAMLSPSMMCVPVDQTAKYVCEFERMNVDYLHIDIMDGHFVPNFTLGIDYIKRLREMTSIPLDLHLMIQEPERRLAWFDIKPEEIVSIHAESSVHLQNVLRQIVDCGGKPFLALNPATPLCVMDYLLDDLAGVLIMAVNPGFAGQKAIPHILRKLKDTREYLNARGCGHIPIEVDGNVSFALAPIMRRNSADIFVLGTSSVLAKGVDAAESIVRFRKCLEQC